MHFLLQYMQCMLTCFNYKHLVCALYGIMAILVVFVVSSGSITVNADSSVQILAEEACLLEDIDVQVCVYTRCMWLA